MSSFTVKSVHHTSFCVSNLERAVAFFRDVLGSTVSPIRRSGGERVAGLTGVLGADLQLAFAEVAGHRVELIQYFSPIQRAPVELRPCDIGATHLAVVVDNLEPLIAAVLAAGGSLNGTPQRTEKGTLSVYMRSPDGIQLEFLQLSGPAPRSLSAA